VFDQQIVDRIFVSRTEDEKIAEVNVERVVFTKAGSGW